MENDLDLTTLRLHDTEDFLSLVPYLLGYRPHEQLVFLAMCGPLLQVTGAVPLDTFRQPGQGRAELMACLDRIDDPRLLLACWSADRAAAEDALALVEVWAGPDRVVDSAWVGPTRWCSRSGGGGGDVAALAGTATAARAVVAGLTCAPSREAALAGIGGPDESLAGTMHGALQRAQQELAGEPPHCWPGLARELLTACHGSDMVGPARAARLAVLAADPCVRRQLWLGMGRETAADDERVWRQVVAATPTRWAVGPLQQLGFASWLAGSGAVLVACVERLARLDPCSEASRVVEQLNRGALPPDVWEDVRAAWVG